MCQNERDGVAHEIYFRVASDIDLIGSYFYRAEISAEAKLFTLKPQASCATFHQHNRIDINFVEIPFLENLLQEKNKLYYFFKK